LVTLGDYIGLLLSELNIARAKADIESVKIAEIYSVNKILQNFPIPRVRFNKVEITAPIAIEKVDQKGTDSQDTSLNISKLKSQIIRSITSVLENNGINLSEEELKLVNKKIEEISNQLEKTLKISYKGIDIIDLENLADEYSKGISPQILELKERHTDTKGVDIQQIIKGIKTAIRIRLISMMTSPSRVNVLVQTSQIKEFNLESLTVLKFDIREDAMEWTEYKTNQGETKEFLVSE